MLTGFQAAIVTWNQDRPLIRRIQSAGTAALRSPLEYSHLHSDWPLSRDNPPFWQESGKTIAMLSTAIRSMSSLQPAVGWQNHDFNWETFGRKGFRRI